MAAARRRRSGEFERESLEQEIDRISRANDARASDASSELLDVPATVLCAFCGDPDCGGCANDLSRSGIVSVVAWERPGVSGLSRLWSTARSTTRDVEGFFELLPDGPLIHALRFALICELLASSALVLTFISLAAVVAPSFVRDLVLDPGSRAIAVRLVFVGLPAFAGLLVLAHAVHGLSIHVGAARVGSRGSRSRALRFGLYACGWDLVMGPIGFVVVALKEGLRAALDLGGALSGLPTRATIAFLRGCYRLDGAAARRALGTSYVGAAVATLAFALAVLVAIAAVVFG
jgi:hypothetical protein